MQIHRDLSDLPLFHKAVATIGTFDGIHKAHQKIIVQVTEEARRIGGESILVTFDPHPRSVLFPEKKDLQLLTSVEEKILLLRQSGIDHLIIIPFTKAFSEQSAQAYVDDFLVDKLHVHTLIIGYDHHFGHHREGNIRFLSKLAPSYGFEVKEIPKQVVHDLTISSTKIRKNLTEGNILTANELLGFPYFILGRVVHGNARGTEIGFPTANIQSGEIHKLIPADGVYAARIQIGDQLKNGALNIGQAPTFNRKERRVEIFIFDFQQDIYNEKVLISLYDFRRPDRKFEDIPALTEQMNRDIAGIKAFFRESKLQDLRYQLL